MGEDAGVDDGVVGAGEHVVGAFADGGGDAADVGDGALIVAGDFAEDGAHVAVLADGAFGGGGGVAELAVGFFEAEDVLAVDVVAVRAELCGGEGFHFDRAVVDDLGGVVLPVDGAGGGVGGDVEFVEHVVENFVAEGAVHGLGEVAAFDAEAPAGAAVGVLDAVTDDAGNAFAGDGESVGIVNEDGFVDGHAGFVVAADAEVAVGAVGEAVDALGHGVVDGGELGVGVLGDGPLAVLAGMALGAEGGGGKFFADEEVVVRDDGLPLDVGERAAVEVEIGLVLGGEDGAFHFDLVGGEGVLEVVELFVGPVTGCVEVGAGGAEEALGFALGGGGTLFDFELAGAGEVAHLVDDVGAEAGGEEVEAEEVVVDFDAAVALEGAEVGHEPEALGGEALAGETDVAGDVGFDGGLDFFRVGFDILSDDGFPAAVEVGGFLLKGFGFGFDGGSFLFDERLGFGGELFGFWLGFVDEFGGLRAGFVDEGFDFVAGFGGELLAFGKSFFGVGLGFLLKGDGFRFDLVDESRFAVVGGREGQDGGETEGERGEDRCEADRRGGAGVVRGGWWIDFHRGGRPVRSRDSK